MDTDIQYVVDNNGNRISVILPFLEWEKLNSDYQMLQEKLEVLQGVKNSMSEIEEAKRTGKKLQTLSSFLHEN